MKTHCMSLREAPFLMIASGKKTFELRLCDEKRKTVEVGDVIEFICVTDGYPKVRCRVTSLHPFPDFASLYASLPLLQCGYTRETVASASPKDMEAYYSPEEQARYGVLGIGIERIGI